MDALRKQIVVGAEYGYARMEHGVAVSKIGIVTKVVDSGVVLKITGHTRAYASGATFEGGVGAHVVVQPGILFPINF